MNFTDPQKHYILRRGELLVDSAQWRLWGLYSIAFVGPMLFPGSSVIALVVFIGLFGWMVFTQKKRTKRILALDVETKEDTLHDTDH